MSMWSHKLLDFSCGPPRIFHGSRLTATALVAHKVGPDVGPDEIFKVGPDEILRSIQAEGRKLVFCKKI